MSKWMICPKRNKSCGDCKHGKRHLHESDCDYLIMCKNKTLLGFSLAKCESTCPPDMAKKYGLK